MFNIRSVTIRWQTHDFPSDDNSNVSFISHSLRDFHKQENIDLDIEGRQGIEER